MPIERIVNSTVVEAGGDWSGIVKRGQVLRLVDLRGRQAVDFLCYNAADAAERYNAADTMKINSKLFIEKGTKLYSDMGNVMFRMIDDTCGHHDTIGGCCSRESNRTRYGVTEGPNCRDNFLRAFARHGLGKKDIVANINFFMYVPIGNDGRMAIGMLADPSMRLAVLSNCPQMNNAANGYNPTPIEVIVYEAP